MGSHGSWYQGCSHVSKANILKPSTQGVVCAATKGSGTAKTIISELHSELFLLNRIPRRKMELAASQECRLNADPNPGCCA